MPLHPASLALSLLLLGVHAQGDEQSDASTAPAPTEERAPLLERSQVDARALERRLRAQEQQHLQTDAEAFLALWLPANTSEPRGVVILLPGDDASADAPRSVGPLRRKLPDAGWHSLSLSLPDALSDLPPPAQASVPVQDDNPVEAAAVDDTDDAPLEATPSAELGNAEPSSDAPAPAATKDPRQAHAARVLARIEAAIAFAERQQAKPLILLGHGSGAYWAAHYLAERGPTKIRHLLLVAAERPEGFSPGLAELIPGLQLATGDFYYKGLTHDRDAALERLQAGKRLKHPSYTQVALTPLPGAPATEQEQLFRRIRGWLERQR
ncbi:alpha/beta hydrolase family protein [Pseudomonas benzenivorans]|uniref:Alpha/beta hydrolase family protein n=1 Tax=Pseudomonas benzenivorans TaxID=556533 RepID=A0ABZ0PVY4_9PSED|nr:alpha/beta hydrolase family protein [Pseudomonas benzenivorans]WPC04670.1 alpha/beta hydrolase family protein [Pseudomonas benzenivorans]